MFQFSVIESSEFLIYCRAQFACNLRFKIQHFRIQFKFLSKASSFPFRNWMQSTVAVDEVEKEMHRSRGFKMHHQIVLSFILLCVENYSRCSKKKIFLLMIYHPWHVSFPWSFACLKLLYVCSLYQKQPFQLLFCSSHERIKSTCNAKINVTLFESFAYFL